VRQPQASSRITGFAGPESNLHPVRERIGVVGPEDTDPVGQQVLE
jgi:hypothetical protein